MELCRRMLLTVGRGPSHEWRNYMSLRAFIFPRREMYKVLQPKYWLEISEGLRGKVVKKRVVETY